MEDHSDPHEIIPISFNIKGNTERKLPKHGKGHIHSADKDTDKSPSKCLHCTEQQN